MASMMDKLSYKEIALMQAPSTPVERRDRNDIYKLSLMRGNLAGCCVDLGFTLKEGHCSPDLDW